MLFRVFGFRPDEPRTHGEFNDRRMHFWLPDFWGADGTLWEKG